MSNSPKILRRRAYLKAGVVPVLAMMIAPQPAVAGSLINLCLSLGGTNCTSQAGSFSIATPEGISIGGNQITGLGNGVTASAGEINSIALGNGASTGAAALSSVAIGNGAFANSVNSVAIGAGSVTSRVNEFSVGSTLVNRQITNVSAGTALTDAVNLGQLNTVSQSVGTNTSNIATLQTNVLGNSTDIAGLKVSTTANTSAVNSAVQSVQALTGSVASVGTTVTGLTTQVAQNTANITTNASGLSSLGTRVDTLATTVNGTSASLASFGTQLTQNTTAIAANTANIATNTSGLSTLGTRVDGLTTTVNSTSAGLASLGNQVAQNTSNITAAATVVATNATGLSSLGTRVDGLTTTVNATSSGLSSLGNLVTQNTAAIANNAIGLATLTGQVSGLGTAVTTNSTAIQTLANQVTTGQLGPIRFSTPAAPQTPAGDTTNDVTLVGRVGNSAVGLHNVASGTLGAGSTDAVNGGQVFALSQTLNALTDLGVSYDDSTHNALTLGGQGASTPVTIGNLGAGRLAADSTAAVNGAQLFATNGRVDTNSQNILQNTTDIGNIQSTLGVTTGQVAQQGIQLATLGGQVTQNATSIAGTVANLATLSGVVQQNGQSITDLGTQLAVQNGRIEANADAIGVNADAVLQLRQLSATGAIGPVRYSDPSTPTTPNNGIVSNDLTLVGTNPGSAVALHNVASGTVSASSTDAVNGSQLYAISSQIASSTGLGVAYDDNSKAQVTLGGMAAAAPVVLANVADGGISAGSKDAVNGGQLFTTNANVTALGGQIVGLGAVVANNYTSLNTGLTNLNGSLSSLAQSAVTYNDGAHTSVTLNQGGAAVSLTNVADGAVAAGSSEAVTGGQLFAANTLIANGGIGPVQYSNASAPTTPNGGTKTNDVTLVGASQGSAVAVHNVASGTVSASSTDAVNGSQLYAISSQIASSTGLGVAYDDNNKTQVTLGGAGAPAPVLVTNVADGGISAGSKDAVNGGQLFTTNANVTALGGQVVALGAVVSNNFSTVSNGLTNLSGSLSDLAQSAVTYDVGNRTSVTFNQGGAAVSLTNVADGAVAAGSKDAVTGGQLFTTNSSISTVSDRLGALSNTLVTNLGAVTQNLGNLSLSISNGGIGPVQYADSATPTVPNGGVKTNDLTLVGAGPGLAVALHNVAPGMIALGSTDAINGAQMAALGSAMASTLGNFSYNPTTNSFGGSFSYDGAHYGSVQSVFDAIGLNLATGSSSASTTTPAASKYFHTNSVLADSQASGQNSSAIGPDSQASGTNAIAMGNASLASGFSSVAIGFGATAQDGKAVSIGTGNIASGDGAVAIGDPNVATGDGATALGKDNEATGTGAIAVGNVNVANQDGAAAIGSMNIADGMGAVSLGISNSANGLGAIAIGSNNQVTGDNSLAIGSGIITSAADTMAIGTLASATRVRSVAIGNRASATGIDSAAVGTDTSATGLNASAFGQLAAATGDLTTAIGSQAQATAIYATAVGQLATASGLASLAVGNESTASGYASAAVGTGSIADRDGSVALGVATRTVRGAVSNYSAFGLGTSQTSAGEVAIARNVSYLDPNTGLFTVTGDRQLTGLAAGSADTDGVNVSQLRGVSSAIGGSLASGLGGGASYNAASGTVSNPSYNILGVTFNNVGDALQALATYSGGTSTAGAGANSVDFADNSHQAITLAANGTEIHNVAAGTVAAGSTDAVNGGQLAATNAATEANGQTINALSEQVQNGAVGVVQYSSSASPTQANGGVRTNDVTIVGANASAPVAVHNVADGAVASNSTDAVNGGQLAATNAHVATVEKTAQTALAMGQNSVQYDNGGSSVTLGSGSGTPVALHNVAAGTTTMDAVNVGQLVSATNSAVAQSAAYTDRMIAGVQFDLGQVRKNASAGTAAAMAFAGMPQPYEAGKGMIAMSAATYRGQSAIALGISKALSDEHTVIKAGATYDSRRNVGASVGIGYQI